VIKQQFAPERIKLAGAQIPSELSEAGRTAPKWLCRKATFLMETVECSLLQ
jgi:hypothetical protein